MNKRLLALPAIAAFAFASCKKGSDPAPTPPTPPPPQVAPVVTTDNDPMLLGNPTNATTDILYPGNYFRNTGYFSLAYNNSRGSSNWVAWHLQSEDLGSAPRQDDFRHDASLPPSFNFIDASAYSGSGFDRGHNCPSADRTSSVPANSSTFLMSNMIPQAPNLNQGPWDELENYTRTTLVGGNNEAYIYMGVTGSGGTSPNGTFTTVNAGKVTVPATIWKVIIVFPKGNGDMARLSSNATVLAVSMPNENGLYTTSGPGRDAWRNYITTIQSIEASVGGNLPALNILRNVHDSIRNTLRNKRFI